MAFVSLFHLLVFMGYLLENGSTAESSSTQTSCVFNTTLRNNPAITCLLLNLKCDKPMFVENCGYINDRDCSLDWCSTDCCLSRIGYGLYRWRHSLNPSLHDCWRMPVCTTNAAVFFDSYYWLNRDVYHCSASYQCISAEIPRRQTVSSTTRSTTTDLKSEKPTIVFRESRKTTDITISDQEKEVSSVIKRPIDSDVSTTTYTKVSDTDSSSVAAIVVPIVLVAFAVGAGVPFLLWKRRRNGKCIRAEKSYKETISAQPKSSSRNTETRDLQSTEYTACAPGVQNHHECHDGIKAVGNQGYSRTIFEENNQCSYINSVDSVQQGLQRSKERLTSCIEYNNTNFLKTRFENDEKHAGFTILNPGNLIENENCCSYSITQDVPCREVVDENNPDIENKQFKTEECEQENHPYLILEPQGNEHSQVPIRHFKTSTASENEENEYNRIQFTKPNAILDDNYGAVSYKSSKFPVNTDEEYSHLGDDAETFRNAMDYSHIRLAKQGKADDKGDYSNLYIKR